MKNRMVCLIFVFLLCLASHPLQACSTFALEHDGQHVVGKNYDWMVDDGLIIINKRGEKKGVRFSFDS